MAISGVTTNPVAFRNLPTPSVTSNSATQPSSAPQRTGRGHHHRDGAGRGGALLDASTSQSGTATTAGTLLNTLV